LAIALVALIPWISPPSARGQRYDRDAPTIEFDARAQAARESLHPKVHPFRARCEWRANMELQGNCG
jgi:hypothetical protein